MIYVIVTTRRPVVASLAESAPGLALRVSEAAARGARAGLLVVRCSRTTEGMYVRVFSLHMLYL